MLRDSKKSESKSRGSNVEATLSLNSLRYKLPQSLSVVSRRTAKKQYFTKRTYAEQETATCIWNTGVSVVDPKGSYLKMTAKIAANQGDLSTLMFGRNGSALNFIREVVITSRSGVELCRIPNFNRVVSQYMVNNYSEEWLRTVGVAMGFPQNREADPVYRIWTAVDAGINKNTHEFAIPLECIAPFFKNTNSVNLPSQLASGLQVQFIFAPFTDVFEKRSDSPGGQPVDTIWSYTIEELYIQCDTLDLADEAAAILAKESAQNGLEYCYPNWFVSSTTVPAGTLTTDITVSKSVSVAKCAFVTPALGAAQTLETSAIGLANIIKRWRFRVGSNYLPSDVVVSTEPANIDGACESYLLSLIANNKVRDSRDCAATTLQNWTRPDWGSSISVTFERNGTGLALSGIPLNNSRQLTAEIELGANADGINLYTTLIYESVARVFLNNVTLKI